MPARRPSRQQFTQYKQDLRERLARKIKHVPPEQRDDAPSLNRRQRKGAGERSRSAFALFVAFVGMLRGHRGILAAALGTLTLSTLIALLPIYAPKIVVDSVLGDDPVPAFLSPVLPSADQPKLLLTVLAIAAVVITAAAVTVGMWGRWHATRVSKRLQVEARRRSFDHAARLPLHRIHELKSGGVAGILRDDAGAVGSLVFEMIYNPWRAIAQLIGSLAILIFVDWRLLLGALGVLPVVWLTHRTWIARIRPMFRDIRETRRVIDSHATEAFGGMRVVRAFGRQTTETASFTTNSNMMIRQELHSWWWMRGVDTAWAVLIPLASAALLWYGGLRILDDRAAVAAGEIAPGAALTVGDLIAFLGYLTALLGPIATLAATATGLQNSLAALDRILDLLDEPREMPAAPDAVKPDRAAVRGRIELHDVAFTYPRSDTPVLQDINLTVEPGQMVALVGPSGAGKTTLCNLVARFYDPTAGHVSLDGVDLRKYDVESYRRLLGIVEQDIFLFDGTIADNIGYAARGVRTGVRTSVRMNSEDESEPLDHIDPQLIDAARRANAHDFITDMPDGYDTLIGERGVKLSGGQRQRLAIARALLADPKILILDEATSNLDTASERLIQQSLLGLLADRTSFVIAHRLSTITHADLIVVMDRGRVIETGTHEQLLAKGGVYEGMIRMQLASSELTDAAT